MSWFLMPTQTEQNAYDEITAWTLNRRDAGFIHQHVVDAWAAQNASENSKPIQIAFALIGLYLHLGEGFSGREVQLVHMRLAQPQRGGSGRKDWPHFAIPKERAPITVIDVIAAFEETRAAEIERWCRSVWQMWIESHRSVKEWATCDLGDLRKHRSSAVSR